MALSLVEIVQALGGTLHGDGALRIAGIAPLEAAGPDQIAFLSNPRYRPQLEASRAGCVIVGPAMREAALARGACIVADDPYAYFARLTQLWKRSLGRETGPAIHPSAVIAEDELHARGMEARRAVLGDEHVDRAIARTTPFTEDFQDLITRYRFATFPPDLVVTVPKNACRTLDFHKAAAMVALGRRVAEDALDASSSFPPPDGPNQPAG